MRAKKPDKPRPDFPLTAHPAGVWVKKIKGKMYTFGGWSDPDAALRKYLDQKDYLLAGVAPPEVGRITMSELVNKFLESKNAQVQIGSISIRTLAEHKKSCSRLQKIIGKTTTIETLRPHNFDQYAVKLASGVSLVTFANRIRLASVIFRFASDQDLIPKPLKFGSNFKIPSKSSLRAERQKRPPKYFMASEIHLILNSTNQIMKAMVLLGINCGYGQMDCSSIRHRHIDLESGWATFPRTKTAIERRCPLWPETVAALRTAYEIRPEPLLDEFRDSVFVTKYGRQYIHIDANGIAKDSIGSNFNVLLKKLGLGGNFRAFYALRRTFETIGGAARDQIPVDYIMGHSPSDDDMSAIYRQHIGDDRLLAVTEYVRSWLGYPVAEKTGG